MVGIELLKTDHEKKGTAGSSSLSLLVTIESALLYNVPRDKVPTVKSTVKGGNYIGAIIWKSGKWGKLKFCDFSFNMGQNLKFKKSYIVKSNSGLNLSY